MGKNTSVRSLPLTQSTFVPPELINLLPPGWPLEVPLARVITCGTVTIEALQEIITNAPGQFEAVYGPPDAELLAKKGTSTAFILLSLLASQPGCYAAKDWLSEKLGNLYDEEGDEEEEAPGGLRRVDNVVSRLRHLLCPPMLNHLPGAKLLRRHLVIYQRASGESGSGYRLASAPLVWVDVEAIGEHIQRARTLEQFGNDGRAEWQAAYHLATAGPFLGHEPYSDWAIWRRQEVETHLWESVQVLWRQYVERGEDGETEAVRILQTYWLQHVTNEDALCTLLELLAKQGYYGQAEEYYAQLCAALALEGKEPNHRTQQTMAYLRSLQYHRKQVIITSERDKKNNAPVPTRASFSSSMTEGILEATSIAEGNVMDQLRRELMKQGVQLAALAPLFLSTMSENLLNSSKQEGVSSLLDSAVEEQLVTAATQPTALNEESIQAFQDIISVCWKFCDFGNILLAEQLLLTFLPQVQQLAESSKEAARLVAEGLRLQSVLSTHQLKLTDKITQCLQSVKYARLASEPNTLASSLHELTAAFRYTHRLDALLPVFQEALSFSEQVLPSIRAGIYAGAAAAFAQRNRQKEADFYIHLAYETAAEETPHILAAVDHRYAHLAEYEGLMYLEIGRPQKAFETFERFTNALSGNTLPERNRLEMLNYQGQAALRLGDVQAYAHCLEKGIEGALVIQSKKRLNEALTLFAQEMPQQWRHEVCIKQVVERFRLSTGGE
jgi:DNA-binding SARP family transcriptional activator